MFQIFFFLFLVARYFYHVDFICLGDLAFCKFLPLRSYSVREFVAIVSLFQMISKLVRLYKVHLMLMFQPWWMGNLRVMTYWIRSNWPGWIRVHMSFLIFVFLLRSWVEEESDANYQIRPIWSEMLNMQKGCTFTYVKLIYIRYENMWEWLDLGAVW